MRQVPSFALALVLLSLSCACPQKADTRAPVNVPPPEPPPPEEPLAPAVTPDDGARVAAVQVTDPLFARVEGTAFDNACSADTDCHTSGCSSEVCSAEADVTTSCEVQSWPTQGASCGCVTGTCMWYQGGTAASGGPAQGTAAEHGMPCPQGTCVDGLRCMRYYGVAGAQGPQFSSCEIPCPMPGDKCPSGMECITISDGPGRVCRPSARPEMKGTTPTPQKPGKPVPQTPPRNPNTDPVQ